MKQSIQMRKMCNIQQKFRFCFRPYNSDSLKWLTSEKLVFLKLVEKPIPWISTKIPFIQQFRNVFELKKLSKMRKDVIWGYLSITLENFYWFRKSFLIFLYPLQLTSIKPLHFSLWFWWRIGSNSSITLERVDVLSLSWYNALFRIQYHMKANACIVLCAIKLSNWNNFLLMPSSR